MSNPYDSMEGFVGPGEAFGWTAFGSSLLACTAFWELLMPVPAAKSGLMLSSLQRIATRVSNKTVRPTRVIRLPKSTSIITQIIPTDVMTSVPVRLFLIKTDTGAMMRACSKMHESAKIGGDLYDELREHGDSITEEVWKADDQEAFSSLLTSHRAGILATSQLGYVNAAMTATVAMLRFIQLFISMVLMVFLAAMAVVFWALMLIPFVGQGTAMSFRTSLRPVVDIARKVIQVMDEIMVKVGWAHAGLVGLMTLNAAGTDAYSTAGVEGHGWENLRGSGVDILKDIAEKYLRAVKLA
jgi:hypothetical protein